MNSLNEYALLKSNYISEKKRIYEKIFNARIDYIIMHKLQGLESWLEKEKVNLSYILIHPG